MHFRIASPGVECENAGNYLYGAKNQSFKILPSASFHLKSHFANAIVTLCSKTLTQTSIW